VKFLVLNCLVERFRSRIFYTFAGSVLISLNPCLHVSRRQSMNTIECRTKYKLEEEDVGGTGTTEELLPHVYSVGLRSLKNLTMTGSNQVIVVSGW
jgi:myosin heavy subunit